MGEEKFRIPEDVICTTELLTFSNRSLNVSSSPEMVEDVFAFVISVVVVEEILFSAA